MSDEEEVVSGEEEEEEEEVEAEEAPKEEEPPKEEKAKEAEVEEEKPKEEERKKPPPPRQRTPEPVAQTEAQKAMEAAKRKHEEEEAHRMEDYASERVAQKEREEEELRVLKEKRVQRKIEQAEEEERINDIRRGEEERRRGEEEARRAKAEDMKRRKEEERRKRLEMMAGQLGKGSAGSGRNYTVTKKDKTGAPEGDVAEDTTQGDADRAAAKKNYLANISGLSIQGLGADALKDKIKELYDRICKLEAGRYDLEKRHETQEYDLKELGEREKQQARNKALARGLDAEEAASSPHPPKMQVSSKYDRQIDRRSYGDRQKLFNDPKLDKPVKVFHGSARPPTDWGRKEFEELELIRKNLGPPKYQEVVKAEAEEAKPPMAPIASKMPELDPDDVPKKKAEEVAPPPAEAPAAEEEEEEEEEE